MHRRTATGAVSAALILLAAAPAMGQSAGPGLGLAVFTGQNATGAGLAFERHWRVAPERFWIGGGLRANYYRADDLRMRFRDGTATTGGDTLTVPDPRVIAVNLMVSGMVRVAGPVGLGANLDVAGFSFGPSRSTRIGREAVPWEVNLFKGGTGDLGTLHSEFYVMYQATRRLTLRAGATHFVLGYKVKDIGFPALEMSDTRYNIFRTTGFVGLRLGL